MKNTYFKVGQEVFDVRFGKGEVIRNDLAGYYGVRVKFNNNSQPQEYTTDGRYERHENISLFQTEPIIMPNVPIVEFEKGEMVWVKNRIGFWVPTFYAEYDNGKHYCYERQQSHGKTIDFAEVRKFNNNPLLENGNI